PEDETLPLAFADWLEEHGDERQRARAELLRVQAELDRWVPDLARRTALQDRERELLAGYEKEWVKSLGSLGRERRFAGGVLHLTMKARTFAYKRSAAGAAERLRRAWVHSVRLEGVRAHLGAVARAPHLEAVAALDLGGQDLDGDDLAV